MDIPLFAYPFAHWRTFWIVSNLWVIINGGAIPGGSDTKESACNAGDLGLSPRLGRSPRGWHGNLLQYSYLENPHGWRSLAGYSPWGCRELDTTEQLSMHAIQFGVLPHSILMLHVFSQEVFFVLISQIVSMFMV